MRTVWMLAVAVPLSVVVAGCGGGARKSTVASGPRDESGVVWLCRPGEEANPCMSALTTTVVGPHGGVHVERLGPAANPPVDCFYVYPTVSGQSSVNANMAIDLRLQEVAIAQAARFSTVCRVYAPVYRQITLAALEHPRRITRAKALVAYNGVARAFRDYLLHYSDGRGIVFIGHSQGAAILRRLIAREVDPAPSLRRRLVSALLMGGNVTSADFAHIPPCASERQLGCVVAYSSFTSRPAANSQFGRTTSDAGVGVLSRPLRRGAKIVCVNPAAPSGGTAQLRPALPSWMLEFLGGKQPPPISTPWASFPGRYEARCESSGNASWLQITTMRPGTGPALTRLQDPAIGTHVLDVNIALDDLVRIVGVEAAAYRR